MFGRDRPSGLTTRGRCLLAGGIATAVCAVVLDERDLLRIGLFVCLLPVVSLLLALRTRRSVKASRSVAPDRVSAGSATRVALALRGGPVPGPLRLTDAVPDAAGAVRDAPPRFTVHRLGSGGATVTYPLRPLLRGAHRIGPLACRATDALGLVELTSELLPADRLLVLPRVAVLRGVPAALGGGEGTPGAAVAHQGQGSPDVLIRGYRHGDELRRVHWKSTARHDELMVRLEERPWRGGITVLLDRRDDAHRGHGPGSSLEFAVSMAASVGVHLIRRGEPVELVTENGTSLQASDGVDALLDGLAVLRPVSSPSLAGPPLATADDLVAVLGALAPGDAETLAERRPAGGYAILLDVATWDRGGSTAAASAAVLRRMGWHVTVVAAGTGVERVWDAVVAAERVRVS
ncbi:DUF58 domain-containing protein [Pseudonocardia sp. T1-2H]|uniref:DUF58 domain-containing protein n=1 Tax=Pseudonocardia sp. T1-2H TaxID=3128899 RepID=UPI0031018855